MATLPGLNLMSLFFNDIGRNAQGRNSISDAAVTAFVDDLSGSAPLSIVDCTDKEQFSDKVSSFANIYIHVLHERGTTLNTKPGKSAIMVSLAGPKSVKAKGWLNNFQGFLTVCDLNFQVVHQYQLLHGVIDASASLDPEIGGRQSAITKICAPYHKNINTKANLTLRQSVSCINSMLVSSLLFNADTWCNMSESQLSWIDSRLASIYGACSPYKVMYSSSNDTICRLSYQHILSITGMPDAYRQLRYRRLFSFSRLLKAATNPLFKVLDASHECEGSFACRIKADLEWLGKHSMKIIELDHLLPLFINGSFVPQLRLGSHIFAMLIIMILGSTSIACHILV